MQQVWIEKRGGPDTLRVRHADDPRPGPGQVRVRVEAAGVNFADLMMRMGIYPDAPQLPAVPGYEVAGRVDAVGPGAPGELEGADVAALCRFGGYSESICIPAGQVWRRPPGVNAAVAAALPVNYLTAYQMLEVMAPPAPGEHVLIHSAAGGVGQAALQLARRRGALVLASASPGKHDFLRDQGVAHVLDSRRRNFAGVVRAIADGRGVDVALEARHGRWIMESYRCLAPCGRLVLFGFASAARTPTSGMLSALRTLAEVPWLRLNPLRLMNENRSVAGVNLGRLWGEGPLLAGWMHRLLALLQAGEIAPRIDRVYPFAAAADAHRRLHERRNVGKVLLAPDPAALAAAAHLPDEVVHRHGAA
ncbi:MAG: zinc-binding dehydrogenase [Candidatus Krumholzibacteriia bacterium]